MLGRSKLETFDMESNKTIKTYKTIYKHLFNIQIKCPKNSEISFQKTRNQCFKISDFQNLRESEPNSLRPKGGKGKLTHPRGYIHVVAVLGVAPNMLKCWGAVFITMKMSES